MEYRWVGLSDWEYSRKFDVEEPLLSHSTVELRCDCIDTISKQTDFHLHINDLIGTIFINDKELGKTDNMFRAYTFNIKKFLIVGSNTIVVRYLTGE